MLGLIIGFADHVAVLLCATGSVIYDSSLSAADNSLYVSTGFA